MRPGQPSIRAAGAVLWRPAPGGVEVCVIHRPSYDDWSLPKGKAEPDEHLLACAVREVAEETGFDVVLGRRLPNQRYTVGRRRKLVSYWLGQADGEVTRIPDAEVDQVTFLPVPEALARLTHQRDAELVKAAMAKPLDSTPLILLRHAAAVPRTRWTGDDLARPLAPGGPATADRLAGALAALGVTRVISSDAVRCLETVRPFAERRGITVETEPLFSEAGLDRAGADAVADRARALVTGGPTVVCTHRPVLPVLSEALTGRRMPGRPLPPAGFLVVHHHAGAPIGVELHRS